MCWIISTIISYLIWKWLPSAPVVDYVLTLPYQRRWYLEVEFWKRCGIPLVFLFSRLERRWKWTITKYHLLGKSFPLLIRTYWNRRFDYMYKHMPYLYVKSTRREREGEDCWRLRKRTGKKNTTKKKTGKIFLVCGRVSEEQVNTLPMSWYRFPYLLDDYEIL